MSKNASKRVFMLIKGGIFLRFLLNAHVLNMQSQSFNVSQTIASKWWGILLSITVIV